MEFGITDEQQAIQETARKFARDKIAPGYQAREGTGVIEPELIREMGALGLVAGDLPEEFGGFGLDGVSAGLIMEEIAYADLNVAYVQLLASLMGQIVVTHARPEVAQAWAPKMVAGEKIVALGLTEPRGGSDAAHLQLKAERTGNAEFVLNGEKTSMSLSDQADAAVIFARTSGEDDGARGVSAFLVPLDGPGITQSRFSDLGSEAVGRGSVFFDSVRVPAENMLGDEGQGFRQVMQGFDYSRALIGLQCLGAARASLDETWPYITERHAFGAPLAQFQGVSFPLAEAETDYKAARLICFETLWRRDAGLPHTSEAAMAKWLAPKKSVDIIHQCLLTHGHSGYSRDLPHQQRLRDVIGLEIGDGTAQIMKLIVAREKVGRAAVQYG
ncbi:MAG: cyclohexanecarboxyl-CoA dehydrogenase [Alphaproteobacteria bacterium]|nr:cyclohexanecarboxyl-CoA dehydrogenase [Alphaproteobacteria bacterium]